MKTNNPSCNQIDLAINLEVGFFGNKLRLKKSQGKQELGL
jgi:hypothetical protein